MILNKMTICDPFVLLKTEKNEQGIATFKITGEKKVLQLDVFGEVLAQAACPIRKQVLLNLLSNHGFLVSPIPGAIEQFLHLLLFPDDAVTILGKITVEDLPEDADIEIVTTCGVDVEGGNYEFRSH